MSKHVKVEATPGDKGLIDWEIDGKKAKHSKIEFKKGHADVPIEFMLKDYTDRKLRFDKESPIWVHEDEAGQCPPKGAMNEQIEVISCSDNKLKLINKNAKECTLRYQLNFFDKSNHDQTCDPEFKNGGGNFR